VVFHGETGVPVEKTILNYQGFKNALVCSSSIGLIQFFSSFFFAVNT
jgi:hypothetical protein